MFGNNRGRKLGGAGKIGKKLWKRKNVLIFLPQFNWLSNGHSHGQHIHGHICMVIIRSRLQSRTSSVKRDQNGTLILNSNVWHSAHSSQSEFACTAKKRLNFVWSLPPCFCGQNMLDRLISTSQKGDICFNSSNISVGKIHANISLFQQNHQTLLFTKHTHQTFINLSCQKKGIVWEPVQKAGWWCRAITRNCTESFHHYSPES